jgi:hypothetical protein
MFEGIEGCRVYMDDVLVRGKTVQEHDQILGEAKARIKKHDLLMNWDKCELRRMEIVFTGEKLTQDVIYPSSSTVFLTIFFFCCIFLRFS